MWSFTSLDFEKFSKPTLVCRKPSTDLGIKRMVGLEIKLDFFTFTSQNSVGRIRVIWRSRSMNCNQFEFRNGCGRRRNGASVEAPEMTDHCLCPYMGVG